MNVATLEFLRHGWEGASMARIARTARISPKTLYARHADKEDLLLAVVGDLTAASRKGLTALLSDRSAEPRRAMLEFAVTTCRHWASDREVELYRLVMAEAKRFPTLGELYRRSIDEFRVMLEDYLSRQTERGAFVIGDVRKAAVLFGHMTCGPVREAMLLGEIVQEEDLLTIVESAVDVFLSGVSKLPA